MKATASGASRLHRTASADALSTASSALIGRDAMRSQLEVASSPYDPMRSRPVDYVSGLHISMHRVNRRPTPSRITYRAQLVTVDGQRHLEPVHGAWLVYIDGDGNVTDHRYDARRMLNIGDGLIVMEISDDDAIAAVTVVDVDRGEWRMAIRIEHAASMPDDGPVYVVKRPRPQVRALAVDQVGG